MPDHYAVSDTAYPRHPRQGCACLDKAARHLGRATKTGENWIIVMEISAAMDDLEAAAAVLPGQRSPIGGLLARLSLALDMACPAQADLQGAYDDCRAIETAAMAA